MATILNFTVQLGGGEKETHTWCITRGEIHLHSKKRKHFISTSFCISNILLIPTEI